ncbi:hypothetical protein [Primorskyibacter marinus]|uniref:hypothetical protein n=1 Tax=Primorskyibacter marinus TaxID=1977320 RepID=UPI0013004F53|nr:hypothetical protein [Primorskyibacter marinus]
MSKIFSRRSVTFFEAAANVDALQRLVVAVVRGAEYDGKPFLTSHSAAKFRIESTEIADRKANHFELSS